MNRIYLFALVAAAPFMAQAVSFTDFSDISSLTLNGSAVQDGNTLRVTPALFYRAGSAFLTTPVTLGPGGSFSTNFQFQITNPCAKSEYDGPGADGIVFVVHNDPDMDSALGAVGGSIGYDYISPSLGIEFDTWHSVEHGDADGNHIGIDRNGSLVSTAVTTVDTRLNDGAVFSAWINYNGYTITVTLDDGINSWKLNYYPIDLDTILGGNSAYVGFTAATGGACQRHDILNWMLTTEADIDIQVEIDIKPGSDPNCFNVNGHGIVPVAVLGSSEFDVSNVDFSTLSFGGLELRVRGNKGPLCSIEYVNADGYIDMVCHFADDASNWTPGDAYASLSGTLYDGSKFEGTDSICIVP